MSHFGFAFQVWRTMPSMARMIRCGSAPPVVHGELDEQEVRPLREHVLLHAEDPEVRAGAADRGVDLGEARLRIGFLEMGEGLHAPAVLRGDRAAEVADLQLRPRSSGP
jgi:hypothetical protein